MSDYAAIVLAGGSGRRMGGPDKPMRLVAGTSMRDRVLAAVADAAVRVVVGPATDDLPTGVRARREEPPGGGPVAGLAAGWAEIAAEAPALVAVLAADLPLLSTTAVADLRAALTDDGTDVALYVDEDGRRQYLCAVWRAPALAAALAVAPPAGRPMRELYAGVSAVEVHGAPGSPPPWLTATPRPTCGRPSDGG